MIYYVALCRKHFKTYASLHLSKHSSWLSSFSTMWTVQLLCKRWVTHANPVYKTAVLWGHENLVILLWSAWFAVVSLAAVLSVVTQHSSPQRREGGALRDDTKNGCEGDYM